MKTSLLSELQARWSALQIRISAPPPLSRTEQAELRQLLQQCTDAGHAIADPVERARLQAMARQIGDAIFVHTATREYPNTAIEPAGGVGAEHDAERTMALFLVPYARNPLFTGREAVLAGIREALQRSRAAGITQAITGLGGVGKSQTALEYAYRYRTDYPFVFWVGAGSEETLNRDYGEIARRLGLAARDATEAEAVRDGVKAWLAEHDAYLLILDNADDPALVAPYLPPAHRGHVLVTSRARNLRPLRVVKPLELEVLARDEAIALLLRRGGRHDDDAQRAAAAELAAELGYLPLALEQAGAYIALLDVGFDEYLALYRRLRLGLLERGRPEWGDTERTVQTTWQASFHAVQAASPAAADLLAVSAFLHAEKIPDELLVIGAPELGARLAAALAGAIEDESVLWELLMVPVSYSLIQRDPGTRSYSVHRLVQEVIRAPRSGGGDSVGMTGEERRGWAERAVRAVNRAFPSVALETWPLCERLLPHALACAAWIDGEALEFYEAGRLLNQTGYFLRERGQYAAAEPLYRQALLIYERVIGANHPDTAATLNNMAVLYQEQGKLTDAEPLFQRALAIHEEALGPDHPQTAGSLNNLARLYQDQGKPGEAEPLYQRALAIYERVLGPDHPQTASSLNNLAWLYWSLGRLGEAEPLYQRALAICERVLGPDHPQTATSLGNLAWLYWDQGKLGEAEALFQRALAIDEAAYGPEHPEVATDLNNLAGLYREQGKLVGAEPLYQRALAIRERVLGPEHPDTASSLNNLAELYRTQGKLAEAEPLLQRALALYEQVLGPDHPDTATGVNNLAVLYREQGRPAEAEALYRRALAIDESAYGRDHPAVAIDLNNLAEVRRACGDYSEAERLYQRALEIREAALGPQHPATAQSLHSLAGLYYARHEFERAQPLVERALAIFEQMTPPELTTVATSLTNLALLYTGRQRYQEAEPLLQRALALREKALGETHPATAQSLNKLADVYRTEKKFAEAEPLYRRAMGIMEQAYGPEHLETVAVLNNLAAVYYDQADYDRAVPLVRRALAIVEKAFGAEDPTTEQIRSNLAKVEARAGRGYRAAPAGLR